MMFGLKFLKEKTFSGKNPYATVSYKNIFLLKIDRGV
jgi:hypothetical protein